MRPIERIPIVLDKIDWKGFLKDILENDYDIDMLIEIKNHLSDIQYFWMDNQDLRLTQVLVNLGIIPNKPGVWYYTEETDWLVKKGLVKYRDILFWGTYGKHRDQPLRRVLIKDMSNEHIENVLLNVPNIHPLYQDAFNEEREYRRKNKIKIND